MPLEETYPAFADKIGKLKSMGIEETEIQPVMQSRIQNLSKMGFSVEEINKALGDVGPTTMQKVAMGPAGSAAEFAGSALSRLAPFPEVWKPDFWNKRPNETTDQQRFRNMYAISNVMPQAVTDTFEGTINQVRKVSPALARIIEDSMAALPPVAGEFASPGKLRALSGETAKPTVAAKPTPAELPAEPAFVKELAREEPTATPAAPPSPESQVDIVRQPQDRAMPGRAGVMVGERKGLPAPEEPLTAAPPNVAGVKDIVDPSKEPPGTGFVLQDYKQEQKALPMPASEMLKQRIEKIQAEHREIAAREAEITANASPPTSEIPERFQETPEKQARAEAKAQEILSKRKRGVQGSIGDAVERKIGEITDTPSKLEFKGKEFEGAVKEGKKIRLKDNPDKVLSKPDDILLVEEKIPFDVPGEGEVYYRSNVHGVNNDKYGVRYFTEEKPVAEKYAEGGEFGRAGSALTEYRGKLNTFDATKATKQEAQHILGKDGMRYLEPDGHISFEAFEYDPAIQKRLRAAGYDSIKVSEGTRGTSVAVLKDESSKLSVYISPKEAPEVSAEVVKRGQEFAGTQEQKPPITVPTARDVVQAGPKPVPSQNLSPEEIAAANEMRGMLGGRRTEPGQVRPAIRLEDGSIVTGEVGKRHDSIFSQLPKGANIKEAGWVDPEGNFMTPKEAQAYKFRSERPVNYKWGDATKTKKSILMKEPVYPKQADAALKEAAKEKVKKEPFSLSGGLIPGDVGQKIFDEGWGKLKDVANIPQKTGDLAKRVAISSNDWLHTMRAKFAPDRLPLGREAGIRLRKAGKESHFEEVKLKLETQALKNFFDRMENKGMGVLDSYERHAMDDIPPVARPYFDYFRKASDVTWKQITEKIDGLENYIENWVGHLYKGDPATNAAKIREWREARQTLTGKEGFLKDRVIPTYEVARREVGLQPLYDNPVDLMVQSLAQERKFLAHLNVVDGAMKDGLLRNITKEMPIDRATEDYLKDSRGNLLNLKGRGVLAGPKDFVRILNNYASPSKMGPFARAIMAPINFINFARVSFSAFHPNFIANADLATSTGRPLVDGLYSLFTGDGHGLKTAAGRLAKAPINPVLDYFKASHTFEALAGKEYPGAESDIALFRESGARVPSSRTSLHIGSELQRLSKLNVEPLHKMLGAALVDTVKDVAGLHPIRTLKDVEKIVGESVMGYIVPRVKAGTQMRLYAEGLEDLAKAKGGMEAVTAAERDSLGFDIENHLNDTMGQIPHDQLYFTNALKNWARFIFAYPTWQLGTFRLAASGAKGAIGSAINLASEAVGRGSPIELTGKEKLAAKYFVGAALVHGIESAIANYVMTGEMPRDHHDFIAARTGKKDANGNDIRLWQPDYFRSYYALRHPVQALFSRFNPVVSKTHELLVNMDYNGNRIYTPGASWSQQSIEMGKSVAETPLPFSYQNIKSMKEQSNITPSEKAHMIMGWTPVPRNYRESNAEGLAHTKFLNSLHALTPAEMEIMKNSAKLSQMFRDKDPQAKEYAKQMLGSGQLTMREVENAAKKSGQRAFVHEIQRLSTKDVFEVWDAAKKEDNAADLKDIQARVLTYLDDKRPGGLVVRIAKDFRTTDPTLIKQQIRKIRDILIYKQQKKETSMEARAP